MSRQAVNKHLQALVEQGIVTKQGKTRGTVFGLTDADTNTDADSAAQSELIKGQRTTMPSRHSGEGLFFTSKAGDEVKIRSHRISIASFNPITPVYDWKPSMPIPQSSK